MKAIDREEDPMLAYIKQKRAKKTNSDVTIERKYDMHKKKLKK